MISREGSVCWYSPGRFDRPTLFASPLDPDAGEWRLHVADLSSISRHYVGESAILETCLHTTHGTWTVTDWMPMELPYDVVCREFGAAPAAQRVVIAPRPDYGSAGVRMVALCNNQQGSSILINGGLCIHSSLIATIEDGLVSYDVPRGEASWFALTPAEAGRPTQERLDHWRHQTYWYWNDLAGQTSYEGPYERQVKDSLRALRLLTHRETGGVIAAATFGFPEVPGGARNYDYRYVWLRDAAMIVSALTRAGSEGAEEKAFLDFLCSARQNHDGDMPLPPFVDLDGGPAPGIEALPWAGYRDSGPVVVGNGAGKQLQLDGLSNVLLAAKLIYNAHGTRDHWETVAEIADYLAAHWQEADHGIWEEGVRQQYTTSKVITSVALSFIAEHSDDAEQAARWRAASSDIRTYVAQHCLTPDGAYAVAVGRDAVDVSAALYPVWDYCAADAPEMLATMARLERDSSTNGSLYRRHLECADAGEEGFFLAGTFWVAQYWIMRQQLSKAESIIDAALEFANDVGLLAEEADEGTDEMLGNLPQAFVHAALIGAAVDLRAAYEAGSAAHRSPRQ